MTSETSQERVSPLLRLLQPGARHEHVFVVCNPRARVVEELVNAKGQDDVVIVFGSPWARRRALARVRKAGLATAEVLARGQAGAGEIVSRHAAALSFSFRRAEPSSWKTLASRSVPGGLLARLLPFAPRVAIVVHSPSFEPAHWLYGRDSRRNVGRRPFVLATTRAGALAHAYRFGDAGGPEALAKAALTEEGAIRLAREAEALRDVAPAAGAAGMEVPQLRELIDVGGMKVLVESFVAGEAAARHAAAAPMHFLDRTFGALADWLVRWGMATSDKTAVPSAILAKSLLEPAESLARFLPQSFLEGVHRAAEQLVERGVRVQTTAAHNDLTMWNVLVRGDGALAVLDWESASIEALPLSDLLYAVVDAVAATEGYADRRGAFRACFRSDGSFAAWSRSIIDEHLMRLRLDSDLLPVSFMSCWLQHAVNEARRGREDCFVSLVRDLGSEPKSFWPLAPHVG